MAAEAREELLKAKTREDEASRTATRASGELAAAQVRLAAANIAAAAALCREGDGRAALRLLGLTADEHRTPEWQETFHKAREISLKQE